MRSGFLLVQELLFQGQGGMDDAGQPLYRASMPHLCRLGRLGELCMKWVRRAEGWRGGEDRGRWVVACHVLCCVEGGGGRLGELCMEWVGGDGLVVQEGARGSWRGGGQQGCSMLQRCLYRGGARVGGTQNSVLQGVAGWG